LRVARRANKEVTAMNGKRPEIDGRPSGRGTGGALFAAAVGMIVQAPVPDALAQERYYFDCAKPANEVTVHPDTDSFDLYTTGCLCDWSAAEAKTGMYAAYIAVMKGTKIPDAAKMGFTEHLGLKPGETQVYTLYCYTAAQVKAYVEAAQKALKGEQ